MNEIELLVLVMSSIMVVGSIILITILATRRGKGNKNTMSEMEETNLCYRCQKKIKGSIYFYVDPFSVFDFINEDEFYCRSCKKIIESLSENYGHFVEIKRQNKLKETI